jgi:glycosyltransferase involved in cell wall biosynthesis
MNRIRVLVINDFVRKGGAEEVYRTSIDVLKALPGVEVTSFDERAFSSADGIAQRAWNPAAARELAATIDRVEPHRVLVHNYHSLLSPAILPVIARYKRRFGYSTFLTCHDYHMVFYNPNLLTYPNGQATPLPLDALASRRRLFARASPRGAVHDAVKKLHWHTINTLLNPADVFDLFLCPSPYMRDALAQRGLTRSVLLPNPVNAGIETSMPKCVAHRQLNLAFVGRVAPEKGLDEFLQLAQATRFHRIGCITVYGEGEQRTALQHKYAPLVADKRLRFAGRLDHAQLFEALRGHDALVLPSIWAENAPLVIVEAAMLGLPVLVHDVGSLSTFGDEIGNKVKYTQTSVGLANALDALDAHLHDAGRRYDWSCYTLHHYARHLAAALQLSDASATERLIQWA